LPKFAIATAAYPTRPVFVAQFIQGVADAAGTRPVQLVMAVEQGFDVASMLPPRPTNVALDLRPATRATTPAGLRRLMIDAVRESNSEIAVFCDFDDRLAPAALDLHAGALASADMSYGEMRIVDEVGRPLGGNFPRASSMPDQLDKVDPLLSRNFMGFSNTAVRCNALSASLAIPDDLVAADWWFFTMLLATGRRGGRTASAVADYRTYSQNVLGANASNSIEVLRKRAEIAQRHYAAVSGMIDTTKQSQAVTRLLEAIDRGVDACAQLVAALPHDSGAWFEDVEHACALLEGRIARVH
jgi:hypothetical protein